ncbi:MAG TPA: hypothetical protein DC000_08980 [Clostridiales bacterium]|nr:hypothetical protein [Clostridiales bacterium]
MQIGLKIKALRLKQGITQEKLAEKLNISSQAISKWENNNATPDISLLPELSVIFGVTIDELFSLTDTNHLDRIEQSLENENMLTKESFEKYNDFLLNKLNDESLKSRALSLLSELHNKQARNYYEISKDFAMQALKLEPTSKNNHNLLSEATNGIICDWNIDNHHTMIEYYTNFIKENPTYARGYLWLLDLLIADGRCEEAKVVLEEMHKYDDSSRYVLYKALIAKQECNLELALKYIDEMMNKYSNDWLSWASKADFMARLCKYDEAINCYVKACELQPSPKYTDSYEGVAHIYEIKKDYNNAIKYYEKVIELLKTEWNLVDGEPADEYRRCIERLKRIL